MGTHYWVLTSASRITTSSVSVAEEHYKSKASSGFKGQSCKNSQAVGSQLFNPESRTQTPQTRHRLEQNRRFPSFFCTSCRKWHQRPRVLPFTGADCGPSATRSGGAFPCKLIRTSPQHCSSLTERPGLHGSQAAAVNCSVPPPPPPPLCCHPAH